MFSYKAKSVEAFGARPVTMVQVERCRIQLGDSKATQMDGLIPVTRPIQDRRMGREYEAMEVDALYWLPRHDVSCTASDEDDCECTPFASGISGADATSACRRGI